MSDRRNVVDKKEVLFGDFSGETLRKWNVYKEIRTTRGLYKMNMDNYESKI